VPQRDQFLEPEELRAGTASSSTIAKPPNMAPATKYGGKIVVCQPGSCRDGEVERHDRVHGEHERRREGGEQEVGLLEVHPVPDEPRQPRAKRP
jgi:hypothetical protein